MAAGPRQRLPRGSLDRDQIVDAAFKVVAAGGVSALTMPRVAEQLGVRTTAVQWHFARKEDLLSALTEAAAHRFNELMPELVPDPWDVEIAAYWREFREIVRAHAELRELVVIGWVTSARFHGAVYRNYERIDRQLGVLMEAGFSAESAARAYHALSTYTRGCLLNEHAWALGASVDPAAVRIEHSADLSGFPYLQAAARYWSPTFASDEDFERGLAILMEGLRRQLAESHAR